MHLNLFITVVIESLTLHLNTRELSQSKYIALHIHQHLHKTKQQHPTQNETLSIRKRYTLHTKKPYTLFTRK